MIQPGGTRHVFLLEKYRKGNEDFRVKNRFLKPSAPNEKKNQVVGARSREGGERTCGSFRFSRRMYSHFEKRSRQNNEREKQTERNREREREINGLRKREREKINFSIYIHIYFSIYSIVVEFKVHLKFYLWFYY